MTNELAYLNSPGVDVAVGVTSTTVTLPTATGQGTSYILVKNVGTAEAFIKGGNAQTTVAASAASGMSIPAGAIESFRIYARNGGNQFTHIASIGAAVTTLRVYCTEGS